MHFSQVVWTTCILANISDLGALTDCGTGRSLLATQPPLQMGRTHTEWIPIAAKDWNRQSGRTVPLYVISAIKVNDMLYYLQSAFGIRRCLTFCHTTEKHTNFIDFSSPCIGHHCRQVHGEGENNGGQTTRSPCFVLARWIYCVNTTNMDMNWLLKGGGGAPAPLTQ